MRFIRELGLQIVERPAAEIVCLLRGFEIPCIRGHLFQILENKQRTRAIFRSECLTELMVYVSHPTVLSTRNAF